MLIKQKSPSLLRNLALVTFGKLLVVFSTKVNLLYHLFNSMEVQSSASDKAKFFAISFSKKPNLDDSGISLAVFGTRTNLILHQISVTPRMVKKAITNLDSSKASGPICIPVIVLKNCEPELSYKLAELYIGMSHRWSLYLRMLGASLQLKTAAS